MPKDPEKVKEAMQKMKDQGAMMHNVRQLNMVVDDASHRILELVKIVDGAGIEIESVQMHKPTLDDVFLSVTGRSIRDESGSFMQMIRQHRTMRQARGGRTRH
jgi:ABC-2 type transport system ATP-binding protein